MKRAREIISLTLDLLFKLTGLVVFVAQGLSGQAGEHTVTLIVCALLLGFGEIVLPYGVFDALNKRKGNGSKE